MNSGSRRPPGRSWAGGRAPGRRRSCSTAARACPTTPERLAAELADVFETFRYQQRGLEPTTIEAPYTVEAHVADALAVLDWLEVDRAVVVGHSWGGHLAMHLAVAQPTRVSAAVIVDPLGAVPDGGDQELEANIMAQLPAELARRVEALEKRIESGEGGEADGIESMRIVWPYYFARPEGAPPMPELRVNNQTFADTFSSIRDHFERETLAKGLPRLDLPLLFVHGRESPIPWHRSEESAHLVPGAMLELVDECGHFPWLEAPGSVRAAVKRCWAPRRAG